MASSAEFQPGEVIVVRGVGLGRVEAHTGDGVRVQGLSAGGASEVHAATALRKVMSSAEADAVLRTLSQRHGDPDPRPWGPQYADLQRALRHGTPPEQAAILQRLYRLTAPGLPQERALSQLDDLLLAELAHVLGRRASELRHTLHEGQPAFPVVAPDRDETSAVAPLETPPAGFGEPSAFRVFSARLAIGDFPGEGGERLDVQVENGEWFGVVDDDEGFLHLVGTRSAMAQSETLRGQLQPLGTVNVEGGAVHLLDGEVCGDRRFIRALGNGEALGRGYLAGVGGDGAVSVAGARAVPGGPVVLLAINFDDEADADDDEGDEVPSGGSEPPPSGSRLAQWWRRLTGR